MKRLLALMGAVLAACSIAGCGGDSANGGGSTATTARPAAAEASGATWSGLQTTHAKFLGAKCDTQSPELASCIALQRAMISSFKRDANELPGSKARADLLGTIDRYYANYEKFSDGYCELDQQGVAKADCLTAALGLDLTHDTIALIVNREAAVK